MTKFTVALTSLLLLALCACKVGPNYKRPDLNVPGDYRGLPPGPQPAGEQFGDMKWWTVFQDEALQSLIKEALTNNYDIRIAASRILQARAALGITRANLVGLAAGEAGYAEGAAQTKSLVDFRIDPGFRALPQLDAGVERHVGGFTALVWGETVGADIRAAECRCSLVQEGRLRVEGEAVGLKSGRAPGEKLFRRAGWIKMIVQSEADALHR